MEINISKLKNVSLFQFSHSVHEGGTDAGKNTWNAAMQESKATLLIDTPEQVDAVRRFFEGFGAWDDLSEWGETELNSLLIQFVSGDVRELGFDSIDEIDWDIVRELQESGTVSSNLFQGDDGEVYFYAD